MFDQAEAFKWIYGNIASFGGNPKKITAWGLSAGGASVGHLELSPYSRDYIQTTIIMSGVPLNPWALQSQNHVKTFTRELAEKLDCGKENQWKQCFKNTEIGKFVAATSQVVSV